MAQRDKFQEIAEVRVRLGDHQLLSAYYSRKWELERAFEKRTKLDNEFLSYFPVALVALVESFFRLAATELIDHGEPYLSNASGLTKDKFDLSLVIALHGKRATIGEFVAHHLPCSNVGHIDTNISTLIGRSFLNTLRAVVNQYEVEVNGNDAVLMLPQPDRTFAFVARAFELRHIICHETPSQFVLSVDEVEAVYSSCIEFLDASAEAIYQTLHPNAPRTQQRMNEVARAEEMKARDELAAMESRLERLLKADSLTEWQAVRSAWENYAELSARYEGRKHQDGSIQPLIESTATIDLVRKRLEVLKEQINWSERY